MCRILTEENMTINNSSVTKKKSLKLCFLPQITLVTKDFIATNSLKLHKGKYLMKTNDFQHKGFYSLKVVHLRKKKLFNETIFVTNLLVIAIFAANSKFR